MSQWRGRPRLPFRRLAVALLLVVALLLPDWEAVVPAGIAALERRDTLQVGTVRLSPCPQQKRLWCGSLPVLLDRDDAGAGTIQVRFSWQPARGRSIGTLVVQEGGPGYSTIGSLWLWRDLFGPLLDDHDLLMVDARGTGRSNPLDCRRLQTFAGSQTDPAFHEAVADCGRQLDHTFRDEDGRFVHASDLFGTVDAVDDLAAVIDALRVGPVDLYGDSYGTFFAQAFAARHPQLLRSLVLDSTWALVDANPWYPESNETLRAAFDTVCERSAACAAAAPGSATERLGELARRLDDSPVRGKVPRASGRSRKVTVTAADLAALAATAGVDPRIYRDLDAAGRAALAGDPRPLLRLAAASGLNSALAGGLPASKYSVGLAIAAPCTDYPQLFDMRTDPAERERQYGEAVDDLPADVFSPFSVGQWLSSPLEYYDSCLRWPAPVHDRELAPNGLPLVPRSLPVLVLAGELDSVTAPGGAEQAVDQLGPSARLVLFPSSTHVVAQGDIYGCASALVRAFVRDPGGRDRLDTSCIDRIPEIRATGIFPLRLADQPLPAPEPGNEASPQAQRLAALSVVTAGDALTYRPGRGRSGPGLRGGKVSLRKGKGPRVLTLTGVRLATDAAVSGKVTIPRDRSKPIVADLVATADDGTVVDVTASWRPLDPAATAVVKGWARETPSAGRVDLAVTTPAP